MADNGTHWQSRIVGEGEESPDQLLANPRNWRIHPQSQQQALARLLDKVGWVQRVIVNQRTGHVVDGHLRVAMAISRNEPRVPVQYVDLSEDEEALVLASLDWSAGLAVADEEMLGEILASIEMDGVDELLADIAAGFGIDLFGDEPADDPGAQVDRAEELREKWQTERGQLWQIGPHRLLCGDSTNADDVARLMGDATAGAVVTDPPYGINREGIVNDDPEGLRALFDGVLAAAPITDAVVIAFQSPRLFPVWLDAVRDAGHKFERALWLYRTGQGAYPWRGWYMRSDVIIVSSYGKPEWPEWVDAHTDCYTVNINDEESVKATDVGGVAGHTTIKPIDVIADLVMHTAGDVYDPFLGSGTTMVAAEQTGRVCYGMEIEPKYVAVTLERLAGMDLEPRRVE